MQHVVAGLLVTAGDGKLEERQPTQVDAAVAVAERRHHEMAGVVGHDHGRSPVAQPSACNDEEGGAVPFRGAEPMGLVFSAME